jgi:methylase of polypeptide subunit release factors
MHLILFSRSGRSCSVSMLVDEIKKILDVGCGTGRTSINIAKHFPDAHVIAIDVVDFAIETANRAKGNENITNVGNFV